MQIVLYSIAVDTKQKLPVSRPTVKVKGQSKTGHTCMCQIMLELLLQDNF